jgi:pSer/pThr/pTyr-binding forkhead associated (FHA) protein
MLAATAEFARQMRIGSLGMTAALAIVAVVAARPRVRAASEIGALSPMQIEFEVRERGDHRTLRLRPPFEVGRDKAAEVVLHDPEVSRRHARFESQQGVVYVNDLTSRNGTFLNGRRVTEAIEVRNGDEIDVGTTRLVVTGVWAG